MNAKFTAPKWKAKSWGTIVQADTNRPIAVLSCLSEENANADLITTSPEMYYMLYNMWFEFSRGMYRDEDYMSELIGEISKMLERINPDVFKAEDELLPYCNCGKESAEEA